MRFILFLLNFLYVHGHWTYNKDDYKEIGDTCSLRPNSNSTGVCKLSSNCKVGFHNVRPILCGFKGLNAIVCCPIISPTHSKNYTQNGYEKLNKNCVVSKTGEIGLHKLLEHCPFIQQEIRNGILPPVLCEAEFCKDLVCCPMDQITTRKKNGKQIIFKQIFFNEFIFLVCRQYDNPLKSFM